METGILVLLNLIVQYGIPTVSDWLRKRDGSKMLKPEDEKLLENGIKVLPDLLSMMSQEKAVLCWYDQNVKCAYEFKPLCGIRASVAAQGKPLSDVSIEDLKTCRWRGDAVKK